MGLGGLGWKTRVGGDRVEGRGTLVEAGREGVDPANLSEWSDVTCFKRCRCCPDGQHWVFSWGWWVECQSTGIL